MSLSEQSLLEFNVGGRIFATTRSTVFSHGPNFISALITNSDKISCTRDSQGRLFVDRNPDGFAMVLDFLRSGQIYRPANWTEDQVAAEFDFYQVGHHDSSPSFVSCGSSGGGGALFSALNGSYSSGTPHLRAMISGRQQLPEAIGNAMEHWRDLARDWVAKNHEKILAYNLEHVRQGSRAPALQFAWHDAQFVLRELSFSYEWGLSALWRAHVAELLTEHLGAEVTLEYSGSSSILTMSFLWPVNFR